MSIVLTSTIKFPVSATRANQEDVSTPSPPSSLPVRPRSHRVRLSSVIINLAERKQRTSIFSWQDWLCDSAILAPTAPDLTLRLAEAGVSRLLPRPTTPAPPLAMGAAAPQPRLLRNLQQTVNSGPAELAKTITPSDASARCACSAAVAPENPPDKRRSLFRRRLRPHRLFSFKKTDWLVAPAHAKDDASSVGAMRASWPASKSKRSVLTKRSVHFTSKVAKKEAKKELRRAARRKLSLLRLFVQPKPL